VECPGTLATTNGPHNAKVYASPAVDSLKVSHRQYAEVETRRNAELAMLLVLFIVWLAAIIDPTIEIRLSEQHVKLRIELMT
jgi:hypothetical protein